MKLYKMHSKAFSGQLSNIATTLGTLGDRPFGWLVYAIPERKKKRDQEKKYKVSFLF